VHFGDSHWTLAESGVPRVKEVFPHRSVLISDAVEVLQVLEEAKDAGVGEDAPTIWDHSS